MLQGDKKIQRKSEAPAIILDYNVQHKDVEKLLKKHWHILATDKHLKNILPIKPNIVYKRAPTIRDLPRGVDIHFLIKKFFFLANIVLLVLMLKALSLKGPIFWGLTIM